MAPNPSIAATKNLELGTGTTLLTLKVSKTSLLAELYFTSVILTIVLFIVSALAPVMLKS
jgi:hypothetical protein